MSGSAMEPMLGHVQLLLGLCWGLTGGFEPGLSDAPGS